MEVIHAHSVSDALATALMKFKNHGEQEESRNGPVLVMPSPVTTVYYQPRNRVLFALERNANPFFHLMESLWMLAGRNDLLFPMLFNQRFREYSDDGASIWGAYGWRWRTFFGYDQVNFIVEELRRNPTSRRAVLAMWNAHEDGPASAPLHEDDNFTARDDLHVAARGGKDVPCNTHAYFDVRGGKLNMTVCNRSNDAWWGAYGANAVHFSILLEYMAAKIGVPVGVYRQMSNNLHLYTDIVDTDNLEKLAHSVYQQDLYMTNPELAPVQLVDCNITDWEQDLRRFITRDGLPNPHGWHSDFFAHTAVPMYLAHEAWRNKQYEEAERHCAAISAWDWRIACQNWLTARAQNRAKKVANVNG